MELCNTGSCKLSDKIWAITDGTKLYRLTFSKSLADCIAKKLGDGYQVERLTFQLGRPIGPGEKSKSGLYALMSKSRQIALRISLFKEAGELLADDDTRYLREAWISR